jgi:hypothetical protein
MQGYHSHWDKYHTVLRPPQIHFNPNRIDPEKIQLICLIDGEVFHEVDVKENKT